MRFHVNSINLKRPKTNVTHLSETWTCSCHGVPAWIYFVCRGRGGQWTFVFKLKHVQIRQTMSYSKLMIHKNIEMADSLMIERLEGLPWHCLQAVIDNFNSSVLVCTFSNHQTNTIITSHCLSIISAFTVALFPVRLPSRDLVVFKCQYQWPSSQSLVVNVNQCHWLTPGRYITDLRLRYNVSCWEMIADQMLKNALTQSD